ncbi:TetR/AcrR family transcriptional regulator [Candidatus Acetothermia bacterium]|nr:TetR/AcrR family transcriptional regulator [Candidatus Acetothermia bacterium]MBI3644070.1 TetR/AcrR family transcriptional regulator [Candidatus Acetothermia bacterium]
MSLQTLKSRKDAEISKGNRTRDEILRVAEDIASAEGLEGLSIGRLAEELKMSKSGLFAHFGSKEKLQLATVEAAREVFINEVIDPALKEPKGMPRLRTICERWLDYAERKVFRGGCFFAAVSHEFKSRPGPIRDRVGEIMAEWLDLLARLIEVAQKSGELPANLDAAQLAFEINAVAMGSNWGYELYQDPKAFDRSRKFFKQRIEALASRPTSRKG